MKYKENLVLDVLNDLDSYKLSLRLGTYVQMVYLDNLACKFNGEIYAL